MGKAEHEQGVASENIVHGICEKIFLSDFVVPNPKYKKNNQEKERGCPRLKNIVR